MGVLATTKPTLLFQAAQLPEYEHLLKEAIEHAKRTCHVGDDLVAEACDKLAVSVGCEILKVVHGNLSTEIDANLCFDTAGCVAKAKKLIGMYEEAGFSRDRILVKLGSTWECIEACRQLQKEGIRCNMTLLFSFAQAVACAEAGATLITCEEDLGTLSVRKVYQYYKQFGYKTMVMGTSFRLDGSELSIATDATSGVTGGVKRKLDGESCCKGEDSAPIQKLEMSEKVFRWMNEESMATEKLSEGTRTLCRDLEELKEFVRSLIK